MKHSPTVSVIFVDYGDPEYLKRAREGLEDDSQIEVIVVDNRIVNRGFSRACNEGALLARGKILLFLNPDALITSSEIMQMAALLDDNLEIGIVGPGLVDDRGDRYLSCTREPSYVESYVVFSFIDKLWPKNRFSRNYWYTYISLEKSRSVGSVSGAALMIRSADFEAIGGFDEKMKLYWEDADLCRRMRAIGKKVWYYADVCAVHSRSALTPKSSFVKRWFYESRLAYFWKHFGVLRGIVLHVFLRATEEWKFILVVLLAAFLRVDQLSSLMPMIPDAASDMLVAVEALRTGELPLLGIPSSKPMFSQGPVFTWMLMVVFWAFGINAFYAGLMTALLGVIFVGLLFIIVEDMFDGWTAFATSLLAATSPLLVAHSRLAFIISPIPLIALVFLWFLAKPALNTFYWFGLGMLFSLLFQFELVLAPIALLIFYKLYEQGAIKSKASVYALGGVILGLWPQVLYDLTHGFRQLGLFAAWMGHTIFEFFVSAPNSTVVYTISQLLNTFAMFWHRMFSVNLTIVSIFMALVVVYGLLMGTRAVLYFKRLPLVKWSLLWLLVMLIAFVIYGAMAEAYIPAIVVPLFIIIAAALDHSGMVPRRVLVLSLVVVSIVSLVQIVDHSYMVKTSEADIVNNNKPYGASLGVVEEIVSEMTAIADGREIVIEALGPGSEFDSTTAPYRFFLIADTYQPFRDESIRFYILRGEHRERVPFVQGVVYHVGPVSFGWND